MGNSRIHTTLTDTRSGEEIQCGGKNIKKLPSISVIIPTYKPNDLIADAIRSCLEQDYPEGKIEIIVSVNGANKAYADDLATQYKEYPQVRVVYTPRAGAGAGRNYGKKFIRTEFAAYLDDDDYFTKGYLKELASYVTDDVTMVCGGNIDITQDGQWQENPFFTRTLQQYGGKIYDEPWAASVYLAGPCMKIFRTTQLQDVWGDFDETLTHTEDLAFWVENIHMPMGKTAIVAPGSKEVYVRRVQEESVSRPSPEKEFEFYVTDTIALIERFTRELVKEGRSQAYRAYVQGKIFSENNKIFRYFAECSPAGQRAVADAIKKSDQVFLNRSKFAVVPAIAFCHEFMQLADPAGVAAVKRLGQISTYADDLLNWTVVRGTGKVDKEGEELFAKYRYTEKHVIPGSKKCDENSQRDWAEKAFAAVRDKDAAYVYSCGRYACSHAAALLYKRAHPETVWIAEVSGFEDTSAEKTSFWRELENAVLAEADKLLFSDEAQKAYGQARASRQIEEKTLIWPHLPMDEVYTKLAVTTYETDPEKINIACFGMPTEKRQIRELLKLLRNPKVQLHIFSKLVLGRAKMLGKLFRRRIRVCSPVSCIEELCVARKMDYLYLCDPTGTATGWPQLPEQLADYLSAGRPVLCRTYPNTPMSKLEHERLIKLDAVDAAFAATLTKTAIST